MDYKKNYNKVTERRDVLIERVKKLRLKEESTSLIIENVGVLVKVILRTF